MPWDPTSPPGSAPSPRPSPATNMATPALSDGAVTTRPIRLRDARVLEQELASNRHWLKQWEATNPTGPMGFDTRASIRSLLSGARNGSGVPFAIEYQGYFAGQLNVSSIAYGSLPSAAI